MKASNYMESLTETSKLVQGEDLEAIVGETIVDIGDYSSFVSTIAGVRASALITPKVPRNISPMVSRLKSKFNEIPIAKKQEFIDRIVTSLSFDLTLEQAEQEEKTWNELVKLGEIGNIIGEVDHLLGAKLNRQQQVDFVADGIRQMIVDIHRIQQFLEDVLWKPSVTSMNTIILGIQTMYMCKLCLAQALKRIERKSEMDLTVQRKLLWAIIALARFDHYRRRKSTSFIVDFDLFWLYESTKDDDLAELDSIVRENLVDT